MAVVTSEKQRKEENGAEVSVSRSPIQSDRSFPHAGEPRKLGIVAIAQYSYSHFSPMRYLFPILRVPQARLSVHWVGLAVSASRFYGRWRLGVDS